MTRCGTAFRAIGITAALVASTMLPGVRASSASDRVVLSRSASRFASAVNLVRRVDPASRVDFELYLGFRRSAEAEALLRQVSTPGTPTYRHYLDPAAFRAEFARPAADVATVSAWLRSQGFTVGAVPANHTTVAASGTAAQVNRALDVRLGYYRTRRGVRRAPDRAPSVPSSLGGIVRGVLGLTPVLMHHGSIRPPWPTARAGPAAPTGPR